MVRNRDHGGVTRESAEPSGRVAITVCLRKPAKKKLTRRCSVARRDAGGNTEKQEAKKRGNKGEMNDKKG